MSGKPQAKTPDAKLKCFSSSSASATVTAAEGFSSTTAVSPPSTASPPNMAADDQQQTVNNTPDFTIHSPPDTVASETTSPAAVITTRNGEVALQIRLKNLPRELCDLIQHFTFKGFIEAGIKTRNFDLPDSRHDHITELKILQLNRRTRTEYAKCFYHRRDFHFRATFPSSEHRLMIIEWLGSMPAEHRAFVGRITCVHLPSEYRRMGLISNQFMAEWDTGNVKLDFGTEVAEKVRSEFLE